MKKEIKINETQIKSKIFEIEKTLDAKWKDVDNISLMIGLSGIPLFYAQMDRWTNSQKRLPKIFDIIEKVFEKINNGEFIITYSSGIIGVAYMLDLLKKERVVSGNDIDEYLQFFDELILNKSLESFINFEHIDFLHGRLGAANYFLERSSLDEKNKGKMIDLFHKIADVVDNDIEQSKKVKHLQQFDDLTHRTNCGLAHGHTSVILIFSKYLELFPDDQKISTSLQNSIECLLSLKSKDSNTKALFPGIAVNQQTASYNIPLGWCYGDQTIAYGLYKASKVIKKPELSDLAYEVASNTLKRDSFPSALSELSDAGFCHGASSLAYMHKVFYQKYKDEKFQQLYHQFTNVTLEKGNVADGLAGYQKYLGNNEYENAVGLLDGIVGVGLFLLDSVMKPEDQIDWQSCFLLE